MQKIKSSEITSESQYMSRRDFLKGMGIASASAMVLAACSGQSVPSTVDSTGIPSEVPTGEPISSTPTEFSEPATSYEAVTNYNNYYECGTFPDCFGNKFPGAISRADGYILSLWRTGRNRIHFSVLPGTDSYSK